MNILIKNTINSGKTAIMLVPEIALTPQMVSWFHGRFGDQAAVLHSGLSAGDEIRYSYYDTLELSTEVEENSFGF